MYFSTQVCLFFVEKGNLKFSDSNMRWREESEKFLIITFVKLKIASKIFGKIIRRPYNYNYNNYYNYNYNFKKTQVALGRPNRYKFYSTA